ncbi:FAS-associated death domain protein [Etheostoma cragini]|uniref:FAS-associated death domain protein n=1 Tax=Etheostoma cragini TaxID=417921 RepID=UPI00155E52BB|nr:FAS-associated death domain protein [Etheostoma cragini]
MTSFQFNAALLDISTQLSAKELEDLKFLCIDIIGKRQRDDVKTGVKLFQLLMERGKLGVDNTKWLSDSLTHINRHDLSDKLNNFESQCEINDDQPDDDEKAKLDIATDVIAEHLGRSWRKLGRRLGLKDVKLDSISKRHPTELEETARELLKEWRKSRGAEARTSQLIEALRACQFNLTADKVEDRLASR